MDEGAKVAPPTEYSVVKGGGLAIYSKRFDTNLDGAVLLGRGFCFDDDGALWAPFGRKPSLKQIWFRIEIWLIWHQALS